jgi:flagellar motor component MotA
MFKVFGFAGFGLFVFSSALLIRSDAGIVFFLGVLGSTLIGCASVLLLSLPGRWEGIRNVIGGWRNREVGELVAAIEEVTSVIRQDGLLALESRRKELKDQNLGYLLKKIMAGFEAKDLIPWIHSQRNLNRESIQILLEMSERFAGLVPATGLVSSLILLSGVLSAPDRPRELIGVAQTFIPFMITLALQVLLDSGLGKKFAELRVVSEQYYEILEIGVSGIQSGLNPELLSDRMRARIRTGLTWAAK